VEGSSLQETRLHEITHCPSIPSPRKRARAWGRWWGVRLKEGKLVVVMHGFVRKKREEGDKARRCST